MTVEDKKQFKKAIKCSICGKQPGPKCVRDQDHMTGKFSGATHNNCSLQYRTLKKM